MWKSLARPKGSSGGGGERNGSAEGQMKNGASSDVGLRPLPASTLETASDCIESTTLQDLTQEHFAFEPTKQNDRPSSSRSSSTSNSSMGGKLLRVFKRKVHSSSGTSKASPDDRTSLQDALEGSRRINRTQDEVIVPARRGQSSVDILEEELLTLRRKFERREAEMEKLKNEVSRLRLATVIGNVQSQSQFGALPVPQDETALVNRSDSCLSDASQLPCVDFSFASNGNLKFEGDTKTKITPNPSEPSEEGGGQTASILLDAAVVGAPRPVEKLSDVNKVSTLGEVRSTTKDSASSHAQELDIVDKHVEAAKNTLDESKAEIGKSKYVEKHFHYHTGGGLKLPETYEELDISTQSYVHQPEGEFFDSHANASRSPPRITSSGFSEEPDFTFPSLGRWTCSDSDKSFLPEAADSSKETGCIPAGAGPKYPCAPVIEVNETSLVAEMRDCEQMDEKSLKVPLSNQTEDSFKEMTSSKSAGFSKENRLTIEIPPPMEDPLKALMNSCVMHEVDKLSKTMKSLQREASMASSKYPDRISRSTSLLSPPHSLAAAAHALPHSGVQVRRRQTSMDSQTKARNVVEQARVKKSSRITNESELESKVLTMSRSERPTEPMAGSSSFYDGNLPLPNSHGRNNYGTSSSTSPESREYAMRTTAGRHEGLSPSSSSVSPSAREFSPSRNYARPRLSFDGPPGWKQESGSTDRVWQNLSSALSGEHAGEEIDIEEEVRQCLEQSRLLLMSDASSSEDERSASRPVSRETSFSVLALSRQRRGMEKSGGSLEMHQQQQEQQAIVPSVDPNTLNIQSGKVDVNYPKVEAEQENEDFSISTPPRLSNSVEATSDEKPAQLSFESGVWDSKLQSVSSPHRRRSRFFIEANTTTLSQVA